MIKPQAVVYRCADNSLCDWETDFFKTQIPFNLILVKHNIKPGKQLHSLWCCFQEIVGGLERSILIDPECGCVRRRSLLLAGTADNG